MNVLHRCAISLAFLAPLTALGCRYIFGITDRNAEAVVDDAGGDAGVGDPDGATDAGDAGAECVPTEFGPCGPKSCRGDGSPGTGFDCGYDAGQFCCTRLDVDGGLFDFDNQESDAGKTRVSPFAMDMFEVTIGRFRAFFDDEFGTQVKPPRQDDGRHAHIPLSGWQSSWNANLQQSKFALSDALDECANKHGSWTNADARTPITCLTWFEAFAFCIWEGGRLPTEAEWSFAASGGDQQRYYPWSVPPSSREIDAGYAVYCHIGSDAGPDKTPFPPFACNETTSAYPVGRGSPLGIGRFGHVDLGGNAFEHILDWYLDSPPFPCRDCAALAQPPGDPKRVLRGGSHLFGEASMANDHREKFKPPSRHDTAGVRCAYDIRR